MNRTTTLSALTTLATSLALCSLAGCSKAIDRDFVDPIDGTNERADHNGRIEPASESPLAIEQPGIAQTERSLFSMSFSASDPIRNVIVKTASPVDVVEQRLVGLTDDEIFVAIELTPPAGTYRRELLNGTDFGPDDDTPVLCSSNKVATFDPRCETVEPAVYVMPTEGEITASQWAMMLFDDETLEPITTCRIANSWRLDCQLSGGKDAAYRLLVFANGFEQLWDGSAGFAEQEINGTPFLGTIADQREWRCMSWNDTGSSVYCTWNQEYVRFNGIDRLRLELEPIAVRITANGFATTSTTAALTWDSGNADLPGPN
ncbi:MAG: hypothetical protein AB7O24_28830 [Kofleriaceae bacterium]